MWIYGEAVKILSLTGSESRIVSPYLSQRIIWIVFVRRNSLFVIWALRNKKGRKQSGIKVTPHLQGGSNMTGTDLYVNKPHCAAAVRP